MKKTRIMPANHWDWSMPVKFSQGWSIDGPVRWIIVGGQISADEHGVTIGKGDIAVQTRNVFESIKKVLAAAGATMADIVKLNTYYVFEGEGDDIRVFWEQMTEVRMQYIADPGPAATAVRVNGLAYPDLLIEVEAIAVVPA
jgi:enamine deaminase RidA (YjgF/YER057c/UK114 family)